MPTSSPTIEGFRVAFRRPSLAVGEIAWRWSVGATAAVLVLFGFIEYLDTLPVTNGERLFLRTGQPYLVAQAIIHILGGSLTRAVMAAALAAILLALLWMVSASIGRIAIVRGLLEYFRGKTAGGDVPDSQRELSEQASDRFLAMFRLNFLRASVALAAFLSLAGSLIVAGFASPDADPQPELAFVVFILLAALIFLAWRGLDWLLSLAGIFAVRDGEGPVTAIAAAIRFSREQSLAVFAVSTWTGLAHLIAFVGATVIISLPFGFAGALPWRAIVLIILVISAVYFACADWLHIARLAGYVAIAERPDIPRNPERPVFPPTSSPTREALRIETTIDRDELILSDIPNLS
ncbi:MAG TPA: hypothetical protein VMG31_10735 [Verrucomicrobiae bacterium]|nr:hypothetical protein [Verrucomicrobiae bacterium]